MPTEVFITHELATRPATMADFLKEKEALQQLAAGMVERPDAVLPEFVALAMEMCDGVSAGLSLFEQGSGAGVFRWQHVVGMLAAFDGATTPRHYSPCGITLDHRGPVLTRHSETLYAWIADAGIVLPEVLLVPLYIGGDAPLGTLWIVSDDEGHFHSGHARIASELATFVGIALHIQQTDQRLRKALDEQETLARETSHRVKNIFALTDSMIRFQFTRRREPGANGIRAVRPHACAR
ncbi:MAG: GAF domain-containing protein [Pseudaminobacter sp.]|nr:GAF domain-containing protein [Pseudaminobacter sp.]